MCISRMHPFSQLEQAVAEFMETVGGLSLGRKREGVRACSMAV